MNQKQTTFGQRVIFINKTKKYAEKHGYVPAGSGKAVSCSKCPHCGKPSLIHFVKDGEDFKDETVGILGVCFNRFYASEETKNCDSNSWVRRAQAAVEVQS